MQQVKSACILFLSFIFLTGILYPFAITGLAQLFFSWKANGSLLKHDNKIIGSMWIGQSVNSANLFQGRPYGILNSSISKLGPTNPILIETVNQRILEQQQINNKQKVPIDLVTASASGLDPDISPAAAYYQVSRIAKNLNLPEETLNALIDESIHFPLMRWAGEPTINVLELNLKLLNMTKPTLTRADSHE